jgi:hypothetical protein
MQYLRKLNCPWNADTCMKAAASDSYECLRYAIENGCPYDFTALIHAINANSVRCIEYLMNSKCPYNNSISMKAAFSIRCLKKIVDYNCSLCEQTMLNAIENDSVKTVKYLLDKGCPYNLEECLNYTENEKIISLLKSY